MSDTYYKPLTPEFRADINSSIDSNISELMECQNNALVNIQIAANMVLKNLIKCLPDGYLMPLEKTKE